MPTEPIFKSSRSQSAAVALASALVLLGSTGLAYLQAGGVSASSKGAGNTTRHPPAPRVSKLWLNYPDTWTRTDAAPDTFVLADPDRPTRRLKIVTLKNRTPMSPEQVLDRCINTRIDAAALENMRQVEPRIVFASNEFGFAGAEFLGISQTTRGPGPDGNYEQHLLACLSNDGINYWLLYLTDTTASEKAIEQSLKANAALLRAIYRSARFDRE